jgi:hypothetical protein
MAPREGRQRHPGRRRCRQDDDPRHEPVTRCSSLAPLCERCDLLLGTFNCASGFLRATGHTLGTDDFDVRNTKESKNSLEGLLLEVGVDPITLTPGASELGFWRPRGCSGGGTGSIPGLKRNPRDHMYYIGLDIHKKTIDANRTQWRQQKTPPT